MQPTILVILLMCAVFSLSFPPSTDSAYISTFNISTNSKQDILIPRQTRICSFFRLRVIMTIIKALLKQISLYLLSHFLIRIIVLTCPDNKSARNHQLKSCLPAKSQKSTRCEANIISAEIFTPFQFVPVCVKTRKYQH